MSYSIGLSCANCRHSLWPSSVPSMYTWYCDQLLHEGLNYSEHEPRIVYLDPSSLTCDVRYSPGHRFHGFLGKHVSLNWLRPDEVDSLTSSKHAWLNTVNHVLIAQRCVTISKGPRVDPCARRVANGSQLRRGRFRSRLEGPQSRVPDDLCQWVTTVGLGDAYMCQWSRFG